MRPPAAVLRPLNRPRPLRVEADEQGQPIAVCLPAGQSAGLIHEIKPAGEIVRDIVREAQAMLERGILAPPHAPSPAEPTKEVSR